YADLNVIASTITGNETNEAGGTLGGYGAGIFVANYCSVTISDCTVSNNYSPHFGGGLDVYGCKNVVIRNSTFSANVAARGGAMHIYNDPGFSTVIQNSTITNNTAFDGGGGGLLFLSASNRIESSVVSGNFGSDDQDLDTDTGLSNPNATSPV